MKYNILDVTFNIPVRIESPERLRNLTMVVSYLQKHFSTNILVGESSPKPTLRNLCKPCGYIHFQNDESHFHRTRLLNNLARASGTPYIVNYDVDVLLKPDSIMESVDMLRKKKADIVFPYGGMFRNIRGDLVNEFKHKLDMMIINDTNTHKLNPKSYGGAVFWNKEAFMDVGMENENFCSWGLEDNERMTRAARLKKKMFRVPGTLYHLDHSRGNDSSEHNPFYAKNSEELNKIAAMNGKQVRAYINTWSWV